MSPKDRLSAFSQQIGFAVECETDVVSATGVPCLLANRKVGRCTIAKSYDPETGKPTDRIGRAVHAVRITITMAQEPDDQDADGRVYHANGEPVERWLGGDGKTWSDISIKKGGSSQPQDDDSPSDVVHRYAKQVVGAVHAAGHCLLPPATGSTPFNLPDTFESRAAIGPVQDRIRNSNIAIVGLGGTGAYVLDLVAKTPVGEIHLLDDDCVQVHNLWRAPGAPTSEEIKLVPGCSNRKVDYYHAKYSAFRKGIRPHAVRMTSQPMFLDFLDTHPIDFAFVCIDQMVDGESPRQDFVYSALSEASVPFIDSGISITLVDNVVTGAVTTSAYPAGSTAWQDSIPNARVQGNRAGYRNVQLPEVNALAASLAVMEWRRRTGQYAMASSSFLHKFRLESARIVTAQNRDA